MHCNGQCVLIKKLKALEDSNCGKSLPHDIKHEAFLGLMQGWSCNAECLLVRLDNKCMVYYKADYSFIYFKNKFRPPRQDA